MAEQTFTITLQQLQDIEIGLGSAVAVFDLVQIPEDHEDPQSVDGCISNTEYAYTLVKNILNKS